jgi:hypothetical protein
VQGLRGEIDRGKDGRLPGAAHDARQRAQQPIRQRAAEHGVRVRERRGTGLAGAAHQRVDRRTTDQQQERKDRSHSGGDSDAVDHQRGCVRVAAGADGARDGRCDGAAHAGIRHLLHQHDQREDQREAGQGVGPQLADEMGVDGRRRRDEHHVYDDIGRRETQQYRNNRPVEKKSRPRGSATCCARR